MTKGCFDKSSVNPFSSIFWKWPLPQWGAVDAEIENPTGVSPGLSTVPCFYAWSMNIALHSMLCLQPGSILPISAFPTHSTSSSPKPPHTKTANHDDVWNREKTLNV